MRGCTVLLPKDDNPIAVNKYIISYSNSLSTVTKTKSKSSCMQPRQMKQCGQLSIWQN